MHPTPDKARALAHYTALAAQAQQRPRSYRCTYTPLDRDGYPVACETGVLPAVQVLATNAEAAQRLAFATVGCPIAVVERLEPLEALA